MTLYDAIVVGAGVEGLFTAYHLVKSNNKTLLLEQFPLPHSRGSSHGQSRTIRKAYAQQYYADMMPEAYSQWRDLEKAENTELIVTTGLLSMSSSNTTSLVRDSCRALKQLGVPYEDLTPSQLRTNFPMMRFHNDMEAVYDPAAGVLRADKVLKVLTNQFIKIGGTLQDDEPVLKVTPGQPVTIITSKAQYQAKSVILCAGPWTSKLVTPLGISLPLKPVRVGVYYWKCKVQQYGAQHGFPAFFYDDEVQLYGLPALEYPNHIKLCAHTGPEIDPDARDAVVPPAELIDIMARFLRKHIPGVEDKPSIVETCIYTMTPDDDFILDTHPQWNNIVIGAGFSGHGFKLAPIVGKVLSELATGRRLSYSLDPFRMDRFPKVSQSKL